jgi:hypothetical protein
MVSRGYSNLDDYIEHMSVNHSKQFSKGITHINTIEGFWSYVKGGLKSYKAVSPKYLPFYLVQYEWQYNHRNYKGNQFEAFLTNALQREKELEYWKAKVLKKLNTLLTLCNSNSRYRGNPFRRAMPLTRSLCSVHSSW